MSGNILVTGFGPFGEHKINSSWEALRLLPDNINGLTVIKQQIPVIYEHVQKNIPLLWEVHKPQLVIHVGVSSLSSVITILNECPKKTEQVCLDGTCVTTGLDVQKICHKVNESAKFRAVLSYDPGRYLCEYIYYQSLNIDKDKSLFIHVPPLDKPYSAKELAEVLEEIIHCSMEILQIREQKKCVAYPEKIYKNGRAAAGF